jgi:hypothetical protein
MLQSVSAAVAKTIKMRRVKRIEKNCFGLNSNPHVPERVAVGRGKAQKAPGISNSNIESKLQIDTLPSL